MNYMFDNQSIDADYLVKNTRAGVIPLFKKSGADAILINKLA